MEMESIRFLGRAVCCGEIRGFLFCHSGNKGKAADGRAN